ncbi:hypothetical protein ACFL2V_01115 [Pseudomonadota bacterium]
MKARYFTFLLLMFGVAFSSAVNADVVSLKPNSGSTYNEWSHVDLKIKVVPTAGGTLWPCEDGSSGVTTCTFSVTGGGSGVYVSGSTLHLDYVTAYSRVNVTGKAYNESGVLVYQRSGYYNVNNSNTASRIGIKIKPATNPSKTTWDLYEGQSASFEPYYVWEDGVESKVTFYQGDSISWWLDSHQPTPDGDPDSVWASVSTEGAVTANAVDEKEFINLHATITRSHGDVHVSPAFPVDILEQYNIYISSGDETAYIHEDNTLGLSLVRDTLSDSTTADVTLSSGVTWWLDSADSSGEGDGVADTNYATISSAGVLSPAGEKGQVTVDVYANYGGTTYGPFVVGITDITIVSFNVVEDIPGQGATIFEQSTEDLGIAAEFVLSSYEPGHKVILTWPFTYEESSDALSISTDGTVTANTVTSDVTVDVEVGYTHPTLGTVSDVVQITVLNSIRDLDSFYISIPETTDANENGTLDINGYVVFDDSIIPAEVVPEWSVSSSVANSNGETFDASIDENGVLITSGTLLADRAITVTATFEYMGTTYSDESVVTVKNDKKILIELQISDPTTVSELSSVQYSALATFDDGGVQAVTPEWYVSYGPAAVDSAGNLTAGAVTTDQNAELVATYNQSVVAKTATKLITINNVLESVVLDSSTPVVERISTTISGSESDNISGEAAVSDNGQLVAFESDASNLIEGEVIGVSGIYLFDRNNKTLVHVSASPFGSASEGSNNPAISGDGKFVVFDSSATNLTHNDVNTVSDIFLFDTASGLISSITAPADGANMNATIDGVGRYIAFESVATSYDSADTNGVSDIYVYDSLAKTYTRISTVGHAGAHSPSISDDGEMIAYEAIESGVSQIYVYNHNDGSNILVSKSSSAVAGNADSLAPSMSGNGTKVAFESLATNLISGATAYSDIYLYDLSLSSTSLISQNGNEGSFSASVNREGDKVVFTSDASNLVNGDNNAVSDVFFADIKADTISLVSKNSDDEIGGSNSFYGVISGAGNAIVFTSNASALVDGDENGKDDVFARVTNPNAASGQLWMSRANEDSYVIGETFGIDMNADFLIDSTIGGGVDISYDPTVMEFVDFDFSPHLTGDIVYHNKPSIGANQLIGLTFGDFTGVMGETKIGTITFRFLSTGKVDLQPLPTSSLYGNFHSAVNYLPQAIDYTSLNLDIFEDADSDGLPDYWEALYGLEVTVAASASLDSDGDNLPDILEYKKGTFPNNIDSDGDGVGDLEDVTVAATPDSILGWNTSLLNVDTSYSAFDIDALTYSWSISSSSGGSFSDALIGNPVFTAANLPSNESFTISVALSDGLISFSQDVSLTIIADTDNDDIANDIDADDDGDGVADLQDAFPLDASESVDTDSDGIGNNADTDDDNDGMPDVWETKYGLDPLDDSDASLDPDHDNKTNLEEYLAGSNPNDDGSIMLVIPLESIPGSGVFDKVIILP